MLKSVRINIYILLYIFTCIFNYLRILTCINLILLSVFVQMCERKKYIPTAVQIHSLLFIKIYSPLLVKIYHLKKKRTSK